MTAQATIDADVSIRCLGVRAKVQLKILTSQACTFSSLIIHNYINSDLTMILYNVTVNVEDSIHQDWVQWMLHTHIPQVLDTGLFVGHKFLKLLSSLPEEKGTTYAIQYFCNSLEELEKYQREFAPALQQAHLERYGSKAVAFRTILEEL